MNTFFLGHALWGRGWIVFSGNGTFQLLCVKVGVSLGLAAAMLLTFDQSFHLSGPLWAFSALKFSECVGRKAEQRQHSGADPECQEYYYPLGFQGQLHLAPVDFTVRKLLFSHFY